MPITLDGTLGITTPSLTTGSFINTGAESIGGSLTFTSTGSRIIGDFSNATVTNRVLFQTSTTNSATAVGLIPNGTSVQSQLVVYNNADPTNANGTQILVNSTESRLQATNNGTAGYLPLTVYTGGSERLRIDTSGNVGIGTSSPGRLLDVNGIIRSRSAIEFTNSSTSATGYVGDNNQIFGSGAGDTALYSTAGALRFYAGSTTERMRIDSAGKVGIGTSSPDDILDIQTPSNNYSMRIRASASNFALVRFVNNANNNTDSIVGTPTANTLAFYTNGFNERMRIDSSGNVGIGITPSAWVAGDTVIQLKAGSGASAVWGRSNAIRLIGNAYYDGSAYKYVASDFATQFTVNQSTIGGFTCSAAPTGTAGATATFTQILSLEKDKSLALQGATTTSGTGITFPATQSASSDANTLDDYEEGTWTPSFNSFSGTAGWTFVLATYVKIGRLVYICATITPGSGTIVSTNNSSLISGLPFIIGGSSSSNSPCAFATNYIETLGTGAVYGNSGIYAPSFSVANSRTIFFSATYQTTA